MMHDMLDDGDYALTDSDRPSGGVMGGTGYAGAVIQAAAGMPAAFVADIRERCARAHHVGGCQNDGLFWDPC